MAGFCAPQASPLAVDTPMRTPVNEPGPRATAMASTSASLVSVFFSICSAIGVSTLEAMAYHGLAAGEGALVCAAMDARRSQIYNALFEIRGGKPVRLCEDRAISLAELGEELGKMQKSAFLVGDGAQLCYNTCLDMGIPAVLAPGNLVSQSAWGVAMAAFGQTPAPAEELLPVYLRLSQAERERQARLAAQAAQE